MKVKKRGVKIKEYGISREKYAELKYFCMQYHEKKREALNGNTLRQKDVEQIEQTALETDPSLYPYILRSVTEGIPYEYMDVPCGRKQFYEARRIYFILLAEKR